MLKIFIIDFILADILYWELFVEKYCGFLFFASLCLLKVQMFLLQVVLLTGIRTAVMIFSLGSLLFTFLVKVAIAIIFENYNIGSIRREEESVRIQA